MSKGKAKKPKETDRELYEIELLRLQVELVEMQEWVKSIGARVVVIFEGRDTAGEEDAIKRVTEYLDPRIAQVVAPPVPNKREENQRFFQRYIAHLPVVSKIKLFDYSWYNRGGAEHVMSCCTANEHRHFLCQCPTFKHMLVEDGITLLKYWFSVSDKEQYKCFKSGMTDPMCQWKLSPIDLESITRWEGCSWVKDEMFVHTDIGVAPRDVMESEDKRKARINMIHHLLGSIPYEHVERPVLEFPKRPSSDGCRRMDRALLRKVPDYASTLKTSPEQKKYVDLGDEEILQGRISSI